MDQQPDMTAMPELRGESGEVRDEFVERVAAAIEGKDAATLRALAGDLHEADMGDVLEALDAELRPRLIELMGGDFDFTALTEVDDTVREEILEELPAETVAEGVRDLDSDDAVVILEDLAKEDQAEILEQLPALERVAIARSLDYPEESAGRRMQTEIIAVPPFWSVGQTIDYMRETPDLPDRFFEIYVVDAGHRFLGALPLDRLLRTRRQMQMSELIEEDRHRVHATDDQEEVARLFERYNLVSVPVIDAADRLVGIMTHDDLVDVIDRGSRGGHPGAGRRQRRGGIVRHRRDDRAQPVSLAVHQPDAGPVSAWVISRFDLDREDGGAGRADADRRQHGRQCRHADHDGGGARSCHARVVRANIVRVVRRELLVGLINGVCFAVIMGVIAVGWFSESADIGLVIGLAMVCVLMAAASAGSSSRFFSAGSASIRRYPPGRS